jgi:hypothetical protein
MERQLIGGRPPPRRRTKKEIPVRFATTLFTSLCLAATSVSVARADCAVITPKVRLEMPSTELFFSGTVVEIVPVSDAGYRATFDVDRVWKGPVRERVDIYASGLVVDAPRFHQGETYVVVAQRLTDDVARKRVGLQPLSETRATPGELRKSGGEFAAAACSQAMASSNGAGILADVEAVIRELGPGRRPTSGTSR